MCHRSRPSEGPDLTVTELDLKQLGDELLWEATPRPFPLFLCAQASSAGRSASPGAKGPLWVSEVGWPSLTITLCARGFVVALPTAISAVSSVISISGCY